MKDMKRVVACLILMMIGVFVLVSVAVAEAAGGGTEVPYTWEILGTIGGATAATLMIVQFIKAPVDRIGHLPTRVLVYIIALLILLGVQAFLYGLTFDAVPLILINAFVVALAAMGAYENTFAKRDARALEPPDDPDNPA